MVHVVQHFLHPLEVDESTGRPGPAVPVCGTDPRIVGGFSVTPTPGEELLHVGTNYLPVVNCRKCKDTDAYRAASEGHAGLGSKEDFIEDAEPAAP